MSESFPPPPQQPGQPTAAAPEAVAAPKRKGLERLVPRSKGARWAALGAAAVIVGGGVAVVAVAEHHDRSDHPARFDVAREAGPGGLVKRGPGGGADRMPEGAPGRGSEGLHKRLPGGTGVPGEAARPAQAPAPLPSLAIGDAADKAAAAVSGGKVESLRVVPQEGGGSAWLAVVLGPDGVRHAVTVSGTDGTVTGNVPVHGR